MLGRRDGPFPLEAVRDMLGLVRAIYAEAKGRKAGVLELRRIERVGRRLAEAIDLARSSREDTVGMRAAWAKAEGATSEVSNLIDLMTEAKTIVDAARARVTRRSV